MLPGWPGKPAWLGQLGQASLDRPVWIGFGVLSKSNQEAPDPTADPMRPNVFPNVAPFPSETSAKDTREQKKSNGAKLSQRHPESAQPRRATGPQVSQKFPRATKKRRTQQPTHCVRMSSPTLACPATEPEVYEKCLKAKEKRRSQQPPQRFSQIVPRSSQPRRATGPEGRQNRPKASKRRRTQQPTQCV